MRSCGVIDVPDEQAGSEALDVQVLDCDAGEVLYEIYGEFLKHVPALSGGLAGATRQALPGFQPVLRAAPAKG